MKFVSLFRWMGAHSSAQIGNFGISRQCFYWGRRTSARRETSRRKTEVNELGLLFWYPRKRELGSKGRYDSPILIHNGQLGFDDVPEGRGVGKQITHLLTEVMGRQFFRTD